MLDKQKTVIALGYFDSVHIGHVAVLQKAKQTAISNHSKMVVFTFEDNLKSAIGGKSESFVYNKFEREKVYYELGADEVYFAPINNEFLSLSKEEFLEFLNEKYSISTYVCGADYRFGKFGLGDVEFLREYASKNSQQVIDLPIITKEGEKIASSTIKKWLFDGLIEKANAVLYKPYSITGEVFHDRKVGSLIGFPTVNIKTEKGKCFLRSGVYFGFVSIDGTSYKAIINYGARPTFDLNEKLIEAHLIDYSGNLYGKTLTITFKNFIREIIKFDSVEGLVNQLKIDLQSVKDGKYD